MENKKIEKRSLPYVLSYILVPALIITICWLLWSTVFTKGNMAVVIGLCIPFLCILWWMFAGRLIYSQKQKKLVRELDQRGFVRNQTFHGTWSGSNPVFLEPISYICTASQPDRESLGRRWQRRNWIYGRKQQSKFPVFNRRCTHQSKYIYFQ